MKTFTTHFQAINPDTQELATFEGPYILAKNWDEAEDYCYRNGLGYLVIDGELNAEVDEKTGVKLLGNVAMN